MNKLKICLLICKSILFKLTNTILTLFRKIFAYNEHAKKFYYKNGYEDKMVVNKEEGYYVFEDKIYYDVNEKMLLFK